MLYLSLKTLHLIAMVTWFAGLFYLPRLYAYHVTAPKPAHAMLCLMEQRLLRIIMLPSIVVVWAAGVGMLYLNPAWLSAGWVHAKLTLLFFLSAYHGSLKVFGRGLWGGTNRYSARFYKFYNEVPSILLIAIILLAVFKPF